jgi:uncharacterized protein with ATP-grasp and redox domains
VSAPEVVSSDPAGFPWSVFHQRHPVLISRVLDALPWPGAIRDGLQGLLDETLEGVLPDSDPWPWWRASYAGQRWTDVPFLWAESYFYQRLLRATGYFTPGPWHGIDPFGPTKAAELRSVDDELAAVHALQKLSPEEQRKALTLSSLWGNRADLGFQAVAGEDSGDRRLLVDDTPVLWSLLDGGSVHLIADNAGRELLPDLILIDHLLDSGLASDVVLHVKPYPYYVSDATPSDVLAGIERLQRLGPAIRDGRLTISTHEFFCSPLPYTSMPGDLRAALATAQLVISKGDLNYRRLVEDRLWPATTPFASLTSYFPAPLVALRTLKCDVVVGLPAQTLKELDATGEKWRTTGTYAVIQARS